MLETLCRIFAAESQNYVSEMKAKNNSLHSRVSSARRLVCWRSHLITLLAVFLSVSAFIAPATAQDALEPVIRPCRGLSDQVTQVRRTNESILEIYEQEWQRLLVPPMSAFGMICRPSFSHEYALTFDSIAQRLVCIEADTSIWSCIYRTRHDRSKYQAPRMKTYVLPVPDSMSVKLRMLWTAAVMGAQKRERKVMTLDGTTMEFFVGGRTALTRGGGGERVVRLLQFVWHLAQAVRKGESADLDALTLELDALLECFTKVSAEG